MQGKTTQLLGPSAAHYSMSIWYFLCMAPFAIGHSNRGENPELLTFFNKLLRLSQLPVHVIFVFDGQGRPAVKRGAKVIN